MAIHLIHPSTNALFSSSSSSSSFRSLSNAIPNEPKTLTDLQPQFHSLLAALSISPTLPGPTLLAQLRQVPSSKLMSIVMTLPEHTFRAVSDDGAFFPSTAGWLDDGRFATEFKARGMELMIGETRDEETLYRETNPPTDLASLKVQVGNYYPPKVTEALIELYLNQKIKEPFAQ